MEALLRVSLHLHPTVLKVKGGGGRGRRNSGAVLKVKGGGGEGEGTQVKY